MMFCFYSVWVFCLKVVIDVCGRLSEFRCFEKVSSKGCFVEGFVMRVCDVEVMVCEVM